MNKFLKLALIPGLVSSMALTGCIDEVEPTNSITQEQLDKNEDAGRALLYAIPGFMNNYGTTDSDSHIDFGYASMMRIRDLMTADMTMFKDAGGYNHYSAYEKAQVGENLMNSQFIWNFYTKQVLTCNNALRTFREDSESDTNKGNRAIALAYRAMLWLDMGRWYECLSVDETDPSIKPNISKDQDGNEIKNPGYTMFNSYGNNVEGLTIPITTENTTEEQSYNNPRVDRKTLTDQILEDLKYAEEHIEDSPYYQEEKILPDLSCVYGLYARTYMWLENYPEAARYAQLAIDEAQASGRSILTESELLSTKDGFNTLNASSWMWGFKPESENRTVTTGICNWISMTSFEASYGYAAVGAGPVAVGSFYERIDNNDYRKLWWVPSSDILLKKINFCAGNQRAQSFKTTYPYFSLKFRPAEGETSDYSVASTAAVPLMRLEEMYFIKMEADAHTSSAPALEALKSWMISYRNPKYKPKASTVNTPEKIIDEIVFQKRVELWGEGQSLFDIKRLNMSVDRTCKDSKIDNVLGAVKFKTNGRPAWMNMVIVLTEGLSNNAVLEWNNPSFNGIYEKQ